MTVGCGNTIVACGTDMNVVFFKNTGKTIAEYRNSHSDVITSLLFYPKYPTRLVSGSEDNLCCIFELTEKTEDEALKTVINTECSVRSIGICGDNDLYIWVITHSQGLSVWSTITAERIYNFDDIRIDFNKILNDKGINNEVNYVISCYYDKESKNLLCLSGNHVGDCFIFVINNDGISFFDQLLKGNKSDIRYSYIHDKDKSIYICGEDGILCRWEFGIKSDNSGYKKNPLCGGKSVRKIDRKPY